MLVCGVVNVVNPAFLAKCFFPRIWEFRVDDISDIVFSKVIRARVDPGGCLFIVVNEERTSDYEIEDKYRPVLPYGAFSQFFGSAPRTASVSTCLFIATGMYSCIGSKERERFDFLFGIYTNLSCLARRNERVTQALDDIMSRGDRMVRSSTRETFVQNCGKIGVIFFFLIEPVTGSQLHPDLSCKT
jgi:hypothetical protein